MNTYMPCAQKIVREWYVIDASGLTLGRLATQVAAILRGKNKPTFTPNMDCGDYVIIVNADKIELTGNKWNDKLYRRHSGYNGGVTTNYGTLYIKSSNINNNTATRGGVHYNYNKTTISSLSYTASTNDK